MNSFQLKYGIQAVNTHDDLTDEYVEEIAHNGYVIIDSGYTHEEINLYRNKLDQVYEKQIAEIGGEQNLQHINDANVVRCLLAYDDFFLKLAMHPQWIAICERMLGPNFVLLMQNGVINLPNKDHYQTRWHRDLNYQHWLCTKPLALSALFCVDPFNSSTGGTHLLPASHLKENFPSEIYTKKHEVIADAPAGSILIMDAMLFHCAGKNSSNIVRRGINHVVGVPILSQQISIPNMLSPEFEDNEFVMKYLGFRWQPKVGVKEWRLERIRSLNNRKN